MSWVWFEFAAGAQARGCSCCVSEIKGMMDSNSGVDCVDSNCCADVALLSWNCFGMSIDLGFAPLAHGAM